MPNIPISEPIKKEELLKSVAIKPLISARNEKTQALLNYTNGKESVSSQSLQRGFKLFQIPDQEQIQEAIPTSTRNASLKLLGVTRSGHFATIEIKGSPLKEVTISKFESCFEKQELGDSGFKNITSISGDIICTGDSRGMIRKNLIPENTNNMAAALKPTT